MYGRNKHSSDFVIFQRAQSFVWISYIYIFFFMLMMKWICTLKAFFFFSIFTSTSVTSSSIIIVILTLNNILNPLQNASMLFFNSSWNPFFSSLMIFLSYTYHAWCMTYYICVNMDVILLICFDISSLFRRERENML